jgi:hypothetical protein
MHTFWKTLVRSFACRRGKPHPRRPRPRLAVEHLEDRLVPAQLTVTSALDPAALTAGTLRCAVNQANTDAAHGVSDTIVFDKSKMGSNTITLQQGFLELTSGSGTTSINGNSQITLNGSHNRILKVDGGALVNLNGLTIQHGDFWGNGGGINNAGTLTVSHATIANNGSFFTERGGGIYNTGTLTLTNVTVGGNFAHYGAGIFNEEHGAMTVSNAIVRNNSAFDYGGGIENYGAMTLSGDAVTGNSAIFGGGILTDGQATVSNTTICGNSATYGGGIESSGGPSDLTLSATTVSGNRAFRAAGIESGGEPFLFDTIVAGNILSPGGFDPDFSGYLSNISQYNLIGDGTGLLDPSSSGTYSQIGTSQAPINPMLAPLGNYGGPTQTMALLPGSPAIGTGGPVDIVLADISATATTLSTSAYRFARTPGNYIIQVGGEQMLVTNVDTVKDTLTVVRGYNGTKALSHSRYDDIYLASDQRGLAAANPPDIGAYQTQAVTALVVAAPNAVTAGAAFSVTITAQDGLGHVATGYTGPATLFSSDGQSVSPSTVTLTNGTVTVPVTLDSAGTVQLTASAGSVKGSRKIVISPAAATSFAVNAILLGHPYFNVPISVTVTAKDAFGNTVTGYNGTVNLICSDGQQLSPAAVTLSNGTASVKVILHIADTITLTAKAGMIQGTSDVIDVLAQNKNTLELL